MSYRHLGQDIGLREEYHPERYPKCTTASEKTIAQLQCLARWRYGEQVRGLGAAASRFEGANPCWVAELPKCPVTPRLRQDLPPTYRRPAAPPPAPRAGAIVGASRVPRPAPLAPQPEPPRAGAIIGSGRQPRAAIPPPPLPAPPRTGAIVGSGRTPRTPSATTAPSYATPSAAAPLVAATANQIVATEALEPDSSAPSEEAQGFLRRNWLWLAAVGTGGYLLYLRQSS